MSCFDENLKTCKSAKEVHSKADRLQSNQFKIWRMFKELKSKSDIVVKLFNSDSDALYLFQFKIWHVLKYSKSKSWFLTKHEKCKIFGSQGIKWTKLWFFERKHCFQNLKCRKLFNSNSNALYVFQSENRRVVKFSFRNLTHNKVLIQNLTSFKIFSPKSAFYFAFQVLTEWWYLLSTLIPKYF